MSKLFLLVLSLVSFVAPAAADIIAFDDRPEGTILNTQYPAIAAASAPVISRHTVYVSKFNVLAQVEPSTASPTDGAGPLDLVFTAPQSRVRLRAGYALDPAATKGGPATITLRTFYYDTKTFLWVQSGTQTATVTGHDRFAQLEYCRPLSSDIERIQIEASNGRIEILDNLEFLDYAADSRFRADFDGVAAATIVTGHYPGVSFTEPAQAVTAGSMTTTAHSLPHVVRPNNDQENHPEAFGFDLLPAQGAVKLRLGYPGFSWDSNPLTVRVTAKNAAGEILTQVDRIYTEVRPITDPVEICRWDELDIARVEVHFVGRSLGGQEVFDTLEYGPVDPASLTDNVAPLTYFATPAADVDAVMDHRDDTSRNIAFFAYSFENVNLAAMWLTQENLITGAIETHPLLYSPLGPLTVFTPPGGSPVTVPAGHRVYVATHLLTVNGGQWRFRVHARDSAANLSAETNEARRDWSLIERAASVYPPLPRPLTFNSSAHEPVQGRPWHSAAPEVSTFRLTGIEIHRDSTAMFVRPPLTPGSMPPPALRERYAATALPGTLNSARTQVDVSVPISCFELAANAGVNDWELWVHDPWLRPGTLEWTNLGNVRVGPWFTEMYGYRFRNVGQNSFGTADFDCIYGNSLMENEGPVRIRRPGRMLFLPIALPVLSAGSGHCFGFSMTAAHMRRGWLDARLYHGPTAITANDIPLLGPALYNGGDLLELARPGSLFAQIKAFHGGQLSEEVIQHVMDQMTGGGTSWDGNPRAAMERIRANPHDFIVTMMPREIGRSHVVLPYAVRDISATETEIWVSDSNFPGHPAATGEDAETLRESCRNTRIVINRSTNRYSYSTNDPWRGPPPGSRYLEGTGLYTVPVSMFTNPRTPPGIDTVGGRALTMLLAGSAEVSYDDGVGHAVGTNPDGSDVYTMTGAYAIPLTSDALDEIRRAPWMLRIPGTEIGTVNAQVRLTGDTSHFYAAENGHIFQLSATGGHAGETDRLSLDRSGLPLETVALVPGGSGRTWYPRVGVESEDGTSVVWRLMGLNVATGERLEFAPRSGSTAGGDEWLDVRNRTGHELSFRLIVERVLPGATTPGAWSYVPLVLPSGADARLYPLASGMLNFALDGNADGVPESVDPLAGTALFSGTAPVAGSDCNANGIPDALDIAAGTLADANGNLIPDLCELTPLPTLTLENIRRTATSVQFNLAIRGVSGSQWIIQRSKDLETWIDIETLTLTAEPALRPLTEGAAVSGCYYRIRRP
jgi:hypothetical protein